MPARERLPACLCAGVRSDRLFALRVGLCASAGQLSAGGRQYAGDHVSADVFFVRCDGDATCNHVYATRAICALHELPPSFLVAFLLAWRLCDARLCDRMRCAGLPDRLLHGLRRTVLPNGSLRHPGSVGRLRQRRLRLGGYLGLCSQLLHHDQLCSGDAEAGLLRRVGFAGRRGRADRCPQHNVFPSAFDRHAGTGPARARRRRAVGSDDSACRQRRAYARAVARRSAVVGSTIDVPAARVAAA